MKHRLKKYLIPEEANEFEPEILRGSNILKLSAVIIALFVVVTLLQYIVVRNPHMLASVVTSVMVDLTNDDRRSEELHSLSVDPVLVAIAQQKANDMAAKGYFAHESPDGLSPWYWFKEAGYAFAYAGENLAVNFSDSQKVEEAWMNSPGHRANILNENFTKIGIATARGEYKGKETTFIVQMFATPLEDILTEEEPDLSDTDVATTTDGTVLGEDTRSLVTEEVQGTTTTQLTEDEEVLAANALTSGLAMEDIENRAQVSAVEEEGPADILVDETDPSVPEMELIAEDPLLSEPEDTVEVIAEDDTFVVVKNTQVDDTAQVNVTDDGSEEEYSTLLDRFLVSPHKLLSIVYVIFAAVVLAVLALAVSSETKKRHVRHVFYAVLLLLLMLGLFYVGRELVFPEVMVK